MAQVEALVLMSGPEKRQFTGIILTQVAVSYHHELVDTFYNKFQNFVEDFVEDSGELM